MKPAPAAVMTGDQYENDYVVAPRHPALRWVVLLGILVVVGAGVWFVQETSTNRNLPSAGTQSDKVGTLQQPISGAQTSNTAGAGGPRAQGTSGSAAYTPEGVDSPAVIAELDTITGATDGHELVGRKVSLHVPVQGKANDVAFWVGEKDNRVLVVLERDRRDLVQRQNGTIADNPIAPVHGGQQADITGTVSKLPRAEAMYSWGLTTRDRRELAERPIYIRADSVTAEGE